MTHKIKLNQGAVKFLRDMLALPGWANTVKDIILGGQLLVDVVPEVPNPPEGADANDREKVMGWANTEVAEFEVTENQREAVRRCLKHFAEKGAIPPVKNAMLLLVAFGYDEK